jgi:hypothetical protein
MTLEEKLADMERQLAQFTANANALQGAIQFCKQLIQEKADAPVEMKE